MTATPSAPAARFFITYPKSGRTWLRFMLDAYAVKGLGLAREIENVFDVEDRLQAESRLPYVWTHLTAMMLQPVPYYAMVNFDWSLFKGAEAVLMTRHFPATLASAYRHAIHRIHVFDGTPSEFIRDPRLGAIRLITFYNLWDELAKSFLARSMTMSYHGLLDDPAAGLRKVLEFARIAVREDLLAQVVEEASFENMRRLSTTPAYAGSIIAPKEASDPHSHKIRTGGRSDWRDVFTHEDLDYLDTMINSLLINRDAPHYARCWDAAPEPALTR